ncbi:MAG TPA: DHH family phosphoesterase, partial [Casimicrobiaceae bacterium]|nr:DHH family phosphoesterase [Casimicrobiaceae bacterium]
MEITRRDVPETAATLGAAGIAPVMARIFAARGIASTAELDNDLAGLPPWQALKGIAAASERLADAIERGERLLIVADYDADGATACAVGMRGLAAMGATVEFLVPNRFEFGYGLTPEIVALAAARQPKLIITVDNGIASVEGVAAARACGIDVLITDHHLPGDRLPDTAWIVNPNQPGCTFASKHLAALLDLVALGTVADVVRLDHANRILVDQGLRRI